jgi:hypothetical protein
MTQLVDMSRQENEDEYGAKTYSDETERLLKLPLCDECRQIISESSLTLPLEEVSV